MKKNYVQPATMVVSVATETQLLQASIHSIGGNTTMKFGGAGNSTNGGATARTKDAGDVYDVWDDDWQNQ